LQGIKRRKGRIGCKYGRLGENESRGGSEKLITDKKKE